jgi:hypothetical protein
VDLKHKNFTAMAPLSHAELASSGMHNMAKTRFAASTRFMEILCQALEVQY